MFSRLSDYLLEHDLFDPLQSAYRPHHSVETLLVNVSSFILREMDSGSVKAMVLLDLSSAFDTVDHKIRINTRASLGVQGRALEWFKSYLSRHSQSFFVNGFTSSSKPLGSVGGPTLFNLFNWSPKCSSASFCSLSFIIMQMIYTFLFHFRQIKLKLPKPCLFLVTIFNSMCMRFFIDANSRS